MTVLLAMVLSSAGAFTAPVSEEPAATAAGSEDMGVPVHAVIRAVARRTGKRFVIDSRLHENVQLVGEEVDKVSYGELLTILQVQGFAAVEGGGFVRVIPDSSVRQSALPLVVGGATYPDAQYVAAVIQVRKVPASSLVPILRPLLPQQAHLAASVCTNSLVMVDTFANVRRIQSLIAALDTGDGYKPVDRCDGAPRTPSSRAKAD